MFIVAYTTKEGDTHNDFYSVHETLEEAKLEYEPLLEDTSVYTASICGVIESTDYSPSENLKI